MSICYYMYLTSNITWERLGENGAECKLNTPFFSRVVVVVVVVLARLA